MRDLGVNLVSFGKTGNATILRHISHGRLRNVHGLIYTGKFFCVVDLYLDILYSVVLLGTRNDVKITQPKLQSNNVRCLKSSFISFAQQ